MHVNLLVTADQKMASCKKNLLVSYKGMAGSQVVYMTWKGSRKYNTGVQKMGDPPS